MDNSSNLPNNYYNQEELKNLLRLLATQNSMWTRSYIVSFISNLDDTLVLEDRIYMNVIEFINVFNIYYSNEVSAKLESLLRKYVRDLTKVLSLLKANYISQINNPLIPNTNLSQELMRAKERWNNTGEEIAKFLASINSNWQFDQFKTLILDHIEMTTEEMKQRLRREYAYEVHQYDLIEYHSLLIADILSNGIIAMFG